MRLGFHKGAQAPFRRRHVPASPFSPCRRRPGRIRHHDARWPDRDRSHQRRGAKRTLAALFSGPS